MKTYTTSELEALLKVAGDALSGSGLSFGIMLSAPVKMEDGKTRPVAMNAFRVEPTQSSNLLNSMWMGIGRYFTGYCEMPVMSDLQPHFTAGAAVAEATLQLMQHQHMVVMGALHELTPTGEPN